jgi:hypothetical protein
MEHGSEEAEVLFKMLKRPNEYPDKRTNLFSAAVQHRSTVTIRWLVNAIIARPRWMLPFLATSNAVVIPHQQILEDLLREVLRANNPDLTHAFFTPGLPPRFLVHCDAFTRHEIIQILDHCYCRGCDVTQLVDGLATCQVLQHHTKITRRLMRGNCLTFLNEQWGYQFNYSLLWKAMHSGHARMVEWVHGHASPKEFEIMVWHIQTSARRARFNPKDMTPEYTAWLLNWVRAFAPSLLSYPVFKCLVVSE